MERRHADPAMNSGNHVMQIGDLAVWMYEDLAGIRSDPERPGFQRVIIHPVPAGDLTFVKASHKSMYGTIATSWKRDAGHFTLEVTIPPNTSALVTPARERRRRRDRIRPPGEAPAHRTRRRHLRSAVRRLHIRLDTVA